MSTRSGRVEEYIGISQMTVQFVEINGQSMAILPAHEFRRMEEEIEDLADQKAADAANARRRAGEEYVSGDLVAALIRGGNPTKLWRCYRGYTQARLAREVGVSQPAISDIESGKRAGGTATLRKIANVLSVELEDLLPASVP